MPSFAQPLVSIVMPSFRHEGFVRRSIDSIVAQEYRNLELIIIDDASPDTTWEQILSCRDDRIRCMRHPTNLGAHATLNEGVALARGELVAILNSDDVFAPTRIGRMVAQYVASAVEDFLAFSDVNFIDQGGAPLQDHPRLADQVRVVDQCKALPSDEWFLVGNPLVTTSNLFCSKSLFGKVGPFAPLRYTHDWDWILRAQEFVQPVWIREPLLDYRVHASNTLSEDDGGRHIRENSLVQTRALFARSGCDGPESMASATCRALMSNDSFHPLAVLCYVIYRLLGISDRRMEELTTEPSANSFLEQLLTASARPTELFGSITFLAGLDRELREQAKSLDERWQAIDAMNRMVVERDRSIEAQGRMLEERWRAMSEMEDAIRVRDRTIRERDDTIAAYATHVAEQDRCVAAQAQLLDERWAAMSQMDRTIEDLTAIRNDWLVRGALRVRRVLRACGRP